MGNDRPSPPDAADPAASSPPDAADPAASYAPAEAGGPPPEPSGSDDPPGDATAGAGEAETRPPGDAPPGPAAVPDAVDGPVPPAAPADAGEELAELVFPSSVSSTPVLPGGTVLGPDSRLRLGPHLGARGRVNRYAASWRDESGGWIEAQVREAPVDHPALRREAEVLAGVQYGMLPRLHASFEEGTQRYLVTDPIGGEPLEDALRAGLDPEAAIAAVVQLCQVTRRLHAAGWAVVGLTPADARLGPPIRLDGLGNAVRIGETPQPLHLPGYSAPELARPGPITGKEDVYSLAAILYRALAGEPIPESGPELASLPSLVQVPGAPQVLVGALAPPEQRVELEEFYRGLLALKQRLSRATVALEVASDTTVGLNPARPVNEDSCGYAVWWLGEAGETSYRALLCVADGMGGMEAGEVASHTALRTLMGAAAPPPGPGSGPPTGQQLPGPPLDLVGLVRQAASAVHAAGAGRDMGTTITCVEVRDGELTLAHVGDTRAYLLRDGELRRLTLDHSLVAAMVSSGVLTAEEARDHPDSNKVLRSLGGQRELPEGYVDDLTAAWSAPTLTLQPDDWLFLCSDGVWGSVDDARIREILTEALDCRSAARAAIDEALRAGAPDNAAAVVARCVRLHPR